MRGRVTKHTLFMFFYLFYLFYTFYTKERQKRLTSTPDGQPCSSCKDRKSTIVSSTLSTQRVLTMFVRFSQPWRYCAADVPGTVPLLLLRF
jgi:Na+/H+ antiporter NhaD/arsenite permease-like protein